MNKEIRRLDPTTGIVRCTTSDERWYAREVFNDITGLPEMAWRPSVTWICSHYPKGKGYEIWLKRNGDEADIIASLAADSGYKEHRAIALLNDGETVNMIETAVENQDGELETLSSEEYAGVMSYAAWWEEEGCDQLNILEYETTVWPDAGACAEKYELSSEYFRFAGTLDLLVERKDDGRRGVIEVKRSADIHRPHELQVCAYQKAKGADFAAILQINYRRNKNKKWKYTEVEDCFGLFIATQQIWAKETADVKPLQRDYPLNLKLRGREKQEA
jgi:hypothetical protein